MLLDFPVGVRAREVGDLPPSGPAAGGPAGVAILADRSTAVVTRSYSHRSFWDIDGRRDRL
jgi:hypothetical protein